MKLAFASRQDAVSGPALAFVADQDSLQALVEAFAKRNWPVAAARSGGIEDALRLAHEAIPREVIVVDVSQSATPAADIAALAASGAARRIVALGAVNDIAMYRDLIAAGAADYMVKPVDQTTLAAVLDFTPPQETAAKASTSRTIVVTGTRGGVGVTTAAVNLAWLLAQEHKKRVALVDFDPFFGTAALALDVQPGRGLREALEQPGRIDSLFVERALEKYNERLAILAAEEPLEDDITVDPAAPDVLLHEVRGRFDTIVVDLPRAAGLTERQILATASHVILVVDCSLAGLRDGLRLQAIIKDAAPFAKLILATGAADRADPKIGRPEVEKALGHKVALALPWDRKAVLAAAGAGKALGESSPSSKLLGALRDLAKLTGEAPAARRILPFFRRAKG